MLYRIARWLLFPLLKGVFCLQVTGRENLPKSGGFILCSNHQSVLDPCLIGAACWPIFPDGNCRRPIRFMAKSELFTDHGRGAAWLLKSLGAFPVERDSADADSIREALQILENGEVLGVFPQGRCVKDGTPFRPKLGAALLAQKSGAPLVPACIQCSGGIRPFAKVRVCIGPPVVSGESTLSQRRQTRQLAQRLADSVNKLLEEES